MAKVYNLIEGVPPANPAAALAAGGSLSVGTTYYYRIVAVGEGNSYYQGSSAMWYMSVPSVEVSATPTSGNQSIRLTFDKDPGSAVFMIYRTTVSGDYDSHNGSSYVGHLLSLGSGARMYGLTTSQLIDNGDGTWSYIDTGAAYAGRGAFIEDGVPVVELEGGTSADPITPANIYDWLSSGGYTQWIDKMDVQSDNASHPMVVMLQVSLRRPFTSKVDTYFRVPDGTTFYQRMGKHWWDAGCYVTMGDESKGYPEGQANWIRSGAYAMYCGAHGEFKILDSMIPMMPYDVGIGLDRQVGDMGHMFHWHQGSGVEAEIKDSIYCPKNIAGGSAGRVVAADLVLDRAKMHTPGANIGSGTASINDCVFVTTVYGHYGVYNTVIDNSKFVNNDEDFRDYMIYGYDSHTRFHNCNFYNDPPEMDAYVYAAYTSWLSVHEKYNVEIKVQDEEGNELSGVNVSLKNTNEADSIWIETGMLTETISTSETAWNVDDGSAFSIGDTIMINLEECLITNIVSNTLTVTRAQNGTEAGLYHIVPIFKRSDSLETDANGEVDTIPVIYSQYLIKQSDYASNQLASMTRTILGGHKLSFRKAGYKSLVVNLNKEDFILQQNTKLLITLSKNKSLNLSKHIKIEE